MIAHRWVHCLWDCERHSKGHAIAALLIQLLATLIPAQAGKGTLVVIAHADLLDVQAGYQDGHPQGYAEDRDAEEVDDHRAGCEDRRPARQLLLGKLPVPPACLDHQSQVP